ncbi:hypothetical protein RR48_00496 [Papilio machaon]|uniref:Uncharacterized protein n=1 Tax=Papilio machaon TaxID=76193 RepID=A0A0N0PFT0_PAPMA|nr:hypothetical protein RR48_00496 [Papilio machaon]
MFFASNFLDSVRRALIFPPLLRSLKPSPVLSSTFSPNPNSPSKFSNNNLLEVRSQRNALYRSRQRTL